MNFSWLVYTILHLLLFQRLHLNSAAEKETEVELGPLAPSYQVEMSSLRQNEPTETLFQLQKKYKLQDFLWRGSGDGGTSTDKDGGLAWEDNGWTRDEGQVIMVTKTMVLFKTVMTTVYSVELTPTVVLSTPRLTKTPVRPEPSSPTPDTTSWTIEPSPTFWFPVEPTAMPNPTTESDPEEIPTPAPDTAHSTNPIYRVNTIIKANASEVTLPSVQFQDKMQKNLARVYALAFKRHLLNSLGIFNKTEPESRRRRRRRELGPAHRQEKEDVDYEWLGVDGIRSPRASLRELATTSMNVTVSIVNIKANETEPRVSMEYIVFGEGKPVPATSAVQDMNLVTVPEMQTEIEYKVIKKAEALVQATNVKPVTEQSAVTERPPLAATQEASVSAWLVLAVTTMTCLIIIIFLLGIIAWKWKQKRISDRELEIERRSPASTSIETGVINPAFISPTHPSRTYQHEVEPGTSHGPGKKRPQVEFSGQFGSQHERQTHQQSLAKDLNERLVAQHASLSVNDPTASPSSSVGQEDIEEFSCTGSEDSFQEQASIMIQPREVTEGRLSPRKRAKTAGRQRTGHSEALAPERLRPLSASSREKVSFGHLDLCDDSIAKPISNEAKKIMTTRPASTLGRQRRPETKFEPSFEGVPGTVGRTSPTLSEQDRDLGDSLHISPARDDDEEDDSSPRKDAQVQTPLRLKSAMKRKPKPKPRRFTQTKKSAESLLSTESEEIFEVHTLDDSSGDGNPLGRMRKRFHQFLDDAFNVIGKKENEAGDDSRTKSAKVSLTHHIETKEISRPWTTSSNVILEESVQSPRPKSASIGIPKRAWTASTQRCHSANSRTSAHSSTRPSRNRESETVVEEPIGSDEELPDQNSTSLSVIHTPSSDGNRSYVSSMVPLFPRYPIYPDIPYPTTVPDTMFTDPTPGDPAVPLIAAIKEEIQRFERVKLSEQQQEFHSRWST